MGKVKGMCARCEGMLAWVKRKKFAANVPKKKEVNCHNILYSGDELKTHTKKDTF